MGVYLNNCIVNNVDAGARDPKLDAREKVRPVREDIAIQSRAVSTSK